MITRSLFFFSLTAAVFLNCAHAASAVEPAPDQTATALTKPENQEKPANPVTIAPVEKKKTPPPVKEMNTLTPFVLKGGFRQLAVKSADEVHLYEGEGAFRRFVDDGSQTVWPIGKFSNAAIPKDEAGFRRVLAAHAGKLGADYVVIVTDPKEIKQLFPARFDELVYCALAYKRVTARLGIDRDRNAALENVTKISGFLTGSHAEESGLRIGDTVKKVEGVVPGASELYWSKAVRWKVGDTVKVEIEREGKNLELDVVLSAG